MQDTIDLLKTIPGGEEFAAFLGDDLEFGDGEIVAVRLDRKQGSELVLSLPWKKCTVTFVFEEWVDVQLLSFSGQNVISGMTIRRALEREAGFAEIGVGYVPAEVEHVFEPCAGAYGTVSGRIRSIRFDITRPPRR